MGMKRSLPLAAAFALMASCGFFPDLSPSHDLTGTVTIAGTPQVGNILMADISALEGPQYGFLPMAEGRGF
jgi:hypothetical protein